MPDITMCTNIECKSHKVCYRFMAKPSHWQSYSKFEPVNMKMCNYFYPMGTVEKMKVSNE